MNLAFGSHFKRFERLLGKIICSSLPIRLTDVFPDITDQFGCGHKAEFLPSVGGLGGRGWEGTFRTNNPYQIVCTIHSLKSPESDFPQYYVPLKDILLLPNLPDSKHLPEERIFGGTDPLGTPGMRHQAKRLCKTNITLLHFLANKPRRELSGTRKNRKIFLHCRTELSKTRHSRKSSYSYSFIREPYQTIGMVYFILGILRTDLWSQGTAPEGLR